MKRLKIFTRVNPSFGRCPDCKSIGSLRRSRSRNLTEQGIKFLTHLKVYRCKDCGWRGYMSTINITAASFKTISFYLIIAAVMGIIIEMVMSQLI